MNLLVMRTNQQREKVETEERLDTWDKVSGEDGVF